MDSPYFISGMPIPSTSRFWATSTFSCSQKPREQSICGVKKWWRGSHEGGLNLCWIWPLKPESRTLTVWCWLSRGQPPSEPCPHQDISSGPWWCGERGRTVPTSCGFRSSCRAGFIYSYLVFSVFSLDLSRYLLTWFWGAPASTGIGPDCTQRRLHSAPSCSRARTNVRAVRRHQSSRRVKVVVFLLTCAFPLLPLA